MNSECKNYPMKEFRAIFPISSILVIRSAYAKKRSFLNISCNSKYMGLTLIWVADLKFRTQKLPYERILGNFLISSILVIRSGYAKKYNFSILAVIQNIWDLHKFGLQIWIHNAKITLWKNFGQFFRLHQFWSSGPRMRKKSSFQY